MRAEVAVPLLISLVLLDVVEVIPAHDNRAVHLRAPDLAGQDAAPDRDISGERALAVDVGACRASCGACISQEECCRLCNKAKLQNCLIVLQPSFHHAACGLSVVHIGDQHPLY